MPTSSGESIESIPSLKDCVAACDKIGGKIRLEFSERNLYRMMLFAARFSNEEILPPMAERLNWSLCL